METGNNNKGWIEIKDGCEMPEHGRELLVTVKWNTDNTQDLPLVLTAFYNGLFAIEMRFMPKYLPTAIAWRYAEPKPEPFTPKPE